MAAVAKVYRMTEYSSGLDINGNLQLVVAFYLSDPAQGSGNPVTWQNGWEPRLISTVVTLSGDDPSSHRAAIEDAVIAAAAAATPLAFNVTRNRVSILSQSGDGIVMKYQRVVPTTGFSQSINNSVDWLLLEPAGTLATGTVNLPAQPGDGQVVGLSTTQAITAFTLATQGGHTLAPGAAITSLAQGGYAELMFRAANNTWYRVG